MSKEFILTTVFGAIDAEVKAHANTYLLIVSASVPFIALYNSGAALFRTVGNSKITMVIDWSVKAVFLMIRYKKGKWKTWHVI